MDRPYKFGFSEFTTWPWPFRRDLERYAAHGARYVEVCEFKLTHEAFGEELETIAEYGLVPSSVQARCHSIFVDSMAPTPKDPDDRIAAIKSAIAMSAPHMPPGTPFIVITGSALDGNMRGVLEKTHDALRDLGDFAAAHKMQIAFEPLNPVNVNIDTALWGLDRGLALVERVNHPAVGLCIDTWNIFETPNLHDVIARCGEHILIVQLSDWKTPRSPADRYSLGDGELDLEGIVRSIRRTGFDGPWVVEILSSLHLDGSLWKSDMDELLARNAQAFERIWRRSEP